MAAHRRELIRVSSIGTRRAPSSVGSIRPALTPSAAIQPFRARPRSLGTHPSGASLHRASPASGARRCRTSSGFFEWPMNVWMAFGFAPASISSEAKVCRHSWGVFGSSSAAFHALVARFPTAIGAKGPASDGRKAGPLPCPPHPAQVLVQVVAQDRQERHRATASADFGSITPLLLVPAALHADQARAKVHVRAAEGL